MKKSIAIVFGANGGIGSATRTKLLDSGYQVIPVNRVQLDFNLPTADDKLIELLSGAQADVIVNASGVFANGVQNSCHETFNINFASNWNIIRYYHAMKDASKPVKIIMIGSSSYSSGKSQYPLYSASKAALYNLWQSAVDLFAETDITVDLINPMRTKTKMNAQHRNPDLAYHEPEHVAEEIVKMIARSGSNCVNMTLKEPK